MSRVRIDMHCSLQPKMGALSNALLGMVKFEMPEDELFQIVRPHEPR